MSAIDGKTLASCFDVASKAGQELEAMSDRLAELLKNAINSDRSQPFVSAHDGGYEEWPERSGGQGWVCTDSAFNLPLKPSGRGRRSVDRYVGFQISMTGDGIDIPGNSEPLLHLFCWDEPIDFDGNWYLGFHVDPESDDTQFEIRDERLMLWYPDEQESPGFWNYSLRLLGLRDEDALRKYCVEPVLKLLKGQAVTEALPNAFLESEVLVKLPNKTAFIA